MNFFCRPAILTLFALIALVMQCAAVADQTSNPLGDVPDKVKEIVKSIQESELAKNLDKTREEVTANAGEHIKNLQKTIEDKAQELKDSELGKNVQKALADLGENLKKSMDSTKDLFNNKNAR